MGVFDAVKALKQARDMQNKMKQKTAGGRGKDKIVALAINGVYDLLGFEISTDYLRGKLQSVGVSDDLISKIADEISNDAISAFSDAKQSLEKSMMQDPESIEQIKSMLGQ